MSKCPNCGKAMSCGCQRRQLPNGKMGCSTCVHNIQSSSNKADETPIVNHAELKDK